MSTTSEIYKAASYMEEEKSLTTFEALQIACEIHKIETLRVAFNITASDSRPLFLEAIAMELGAAIDGDTIKTQLNEIAFEIRNLISQGKSES